MQEWEYKGFTIRKRSKGLHTSAYDYDWSYYVSNGLLNAGPFWKYAPNLEAAKDDIDIHLIDESFCKFDTGL